MFARIIKSYRDIVAVCDEDLLGKKFYEGNFQLDIKESFFNGKDSLELNEEKLVEFLKQMSVEDATFNIVGENSIKSAIKAGIISENQVRKISGTPFTIVLL
ncbi:DUF424 family protein [Candidatus Pacearchaeota archaeon]|nr:DUF424 family protein [Candidatus Pacearchaeota archaeon]